MNAGEDVEKRELSYTAIGGEVKVLVAQLCQFFVTPWTVAHQAPLFMQFSRQEYWSW